jgi:polyphosphate:AMP phosphotransferase
MGDETMADKINYKDTLVILEKTLAMLQQTLINLEIPVMIVFEGFSASGKGTCIARAVHPLDPRFFTVCTMGKANEEMQMRPFLWPFWTRLPAKGRITFFVKSWHRIILPANRAIWKLSPSEVSGFYHDVNAFEKQLTEDGTLIIKLFLHIDKDEQRKRFKELEKNPDTAWRINDYDRDQNRHYEQHKRAYDLMLAQTQTPENPWHIIDANDKKNSVIAMLRTVIKYIESRIRDESTPEIINTNALTKIPSVIAAVEPNQSMDDAVYKKELTHYQKQLSMLGYKMYSKRRPAIVVFEGWDAAGKGGCIKRLTEELDPRCYEVVPIAAPTPLEFSHHYLWRFYTKLPKDGHLTIFDRSWYGRVLIERVERLTPESAWRRAYQEINDMEAHLTHHGGIIIKFLLLIDQEEQLKRFSDRKNDPLKQYKLTDDDWRNREKWEQYVIAADDMLHKTNTPYAPWTVVESNNKKFARLKVLKNVVSVLKRELQ